MSALDVDRSASRSPMSRRSSFLSPSNSLTHSLILEAITNSPDNGATLYLSRKNITDIGGAAAELATIGMEPPEDESCVRRLALNHNRLTTIPMEFALLSRLRYLNLSSNNFTVFPDVLTLMPSLDVLDLSCNKIKRLPTQPGNLVNLKTFVLFRNKITRLPTYLVKFHKLNVLRVERNPIEWPPRSVMERNFAKDDTEAMGNWVRGVKRWINAECNRGTNHHDDSGFGDLESRLDDSYWGRLPISESEFDEGVTPHARSFSIDSSFSVSSLADSVAMDTPATVYDESPERPPPLHIGILQSYSAETSPTQSLESYLPSPAESDTFPDKLANEVVRNDDLPLHNRNASDSYNARRIAPLAGQKKSMPDLRTARLNFTKKTPDLADRRPALPNGKPHFDEFSIPSPMSQRQDSGSSLSSGSRHATRPFGKDYPTHSSPTRAVPSMALERNSYFRRLSTLPHTNNMPKPMLTLIDTARSILFALCQIYQTLEHYTLQSIDDRLSSVLKKVLHPASADMMQFINSLDRFDAMSRKTIPPPSVCRAVVESCRDTVAVFGKTVAVLSLQLKVIVNSDDLRYSRNLVLMLYGATAEISLAWQSMLPHIDAIKPLLHIKSFQAPSPPNGFGLVGGSLESPSMDSPTTSFASLRSNPGSRTHQARRHAGSFSSKDVEIGKALPSYDVVPISSLSRRVVPASFMKTALRAPKRQATLAPTSVTVRSPSPTGSHIPGSASTSSTAESSTKVSHSRSGSQASLQASSTSSSPVISANSKTTFLDLPSTSKVQVDKEAIQAVQDAVDVAPSVWDMMEEALNSVLSSRPDIRESLEKARSVTSSLAEMIRTIRDGDELADKKSLREEAHAFLKHVVHLSNAVKSNGGHVSNALRLGMVKLTNSTEVFAILLHVSSYTSFPSSSSSSYRPYSPMLPSQSHTNLLNLPEETRLGPPLSRSRSAQATTTASKSPASPIPDGSRSALPMNQTFKLPIIRRLGNDPG